MATWKFALHPKRQRSLRSNVSIACPECQGIRFDRDEVFVDIPVPILRDLARIDAACEACGEGVREAGGMDDAWWRSVAPATVVARAPVDDGFGTGTPDAQVFPEDLEPHDVESKSMNELVVDLAASIRELEDLNEDQHREINETIGNLTARISLQKEWADVLAMASNADRKDNEAAFKGLSDRMDNLEARLEARLVEHLVALEAAEGKVERIAALVEPVVGRVGEMRAAVEGIEAGYIGPGTPPASVRRLRAAVDALSNDDGTSE